MKNGQSTPFGQRLVQARKAAKLTQQAAAKKVGMSQGTLGELEREGQGSSYTAALATLYGVDSLWLATGKGSPDLKTPRLEVVPAQEIHPDQVDLNDVIELLALFQQASKNEREFILESARQASKARQAKWVRLGGDKS